MKTINGHQSPLISEYRMHNILTFNYDKTENIFKTIEENNQITSNFTNIKNCKSLYSDISETLSYVTKDNKGFVTMEGNKSELIDKEDLIDCEFVNDVFLTRNEVIIKEKVFQLPYLDLNDKFIKIISSSKKSFCFLLTENGKIFVNGENRSNVFGISNANINFEEFTLHPNLEHVTSKIIDIKCGYSFCVLRCENGDCYGAGYNCYNNIGITEKRTMSVDKFTLIEKLKGKVKQHFCGYFHSLYLTFDNEVYGSGLNSSGQFGKQYDTNIYSDCLPLTKITFNNTGSSIHSFKSILASGYNSVFLNDNNTIIFCRKNKPFSISNKKLIDEYACEIDCGLDRYLKSFGMNRGEMIELGIQVFSNSFRGIVLCKSVSSSKSLQYFRDNLEKVHYFSLLSDMDIKFFKDNI